MTDTMHPNLSIMNRLDIKNLDACADVFADSFVWHYINPKLPKIEGNYQGVSGLKSFFSKMNETSFVAALPGKPGASLAFHIGLAIAVGAIASAPFGIGKHHDTTHGMESGIIPCCKGPRHEPNRGLLTCREHPVRSLSARAGNDVQIIAPSQSKS